MSSGNVRSNHNADLEFSNSNASLANYASVLAWQKQSKPLWLFWIPAMLWLVAWWYVSRTAQPAGASLLVPAPTVRQWRWKTPLYSLAVILAALAIGRTALHLVPLGFRVTPKTLRLARDYLIAAGEAREMDHLSTNRFWSGKKLATLLQHVELTHYTRGLLNWTLNEEAHRKFVLSPEISPEFDGGMHWRRLLWESFYPRIRKEKSPADAARIVIRHLRERVTIVGDFVGTGSVPPEAENEAPDPPTADFACFPQSIEEIWIHQMANEKGFEAIYVAVLRSVGIPARLDGQGKAEYHDGAGWQSAPRPILEIL